MATIKVRQNGPYLVEGDDVTRRGLERERVSDREAAVRAVPLRRVDEQAVLRRHALADRVFRRRSGGARQRRQAGTIAGGQVGQVGGQLGKTGAAAMPSERLRASQLRWPRDSRLVIVARRERDRWLRRSGKSWPIYRVTRFPARYLAHSVSRDVHVAIFRVFEMSASGSASSTTKSAHLPASSVPSPIELHGSARRRASPTQHLLRRQPGLRHQLELHQLEVALEPRRPDRCRCPSRSARRRRTAS